MHQRALKSAHDQPIITSVIANRPYPRNFIWASKDVALKNQHVMRTIWMAHNHPSGDPTPSRADEALTQTLKTALAMLTSGCSITSSSPRCSIEPGRARLGLSLNPEPTMLNPAPGLHIGRAGRCGKPSLQPKDGFACVQPCKHSRSPWRSRHSSFHQPGRGWLPAGLPSTTCSKEVFYGTCTVLHAGLYWPHAKAPSHSNHDEAFGGNLERCSGSCHRKCSPKLLAEKLHHLVPELLEATMA